MIANQFREACFYLEQILRLELLGASKFECPSTAQAPLLGVSALREWYSALN